MKFRSSNLRRRLGAVVLALTAFVAAGEVAAADRPGRGGRPPMLRGGGFGPRAMRGGPPPQQLREQPAAVERAAEAPQAPVGRPGRLTPDERRALRQQINDAGRNIYRVPR